jgi:dolichyl-phosphate-mannose--protein O-mannosyl transferase
VFSFHAAVPLIIEYVRSMATTSGNIIKHMLLKIFLMKIVKNCVSLSKYKMQYSACKSAVRQEKVKMAK